MKARALAHRRLLAHLAIIVIAMCSAGFLAWIGIDVLSGRSDSQFFADSTTYHEAARGDLIQLDSIGDLVGVASNFLGPVALVKLAGDNYYAVMLINAALLAFAIGSLSLTLRLNALALLGWLLLNPLTISSVLSVNKEVLSLVVVALLVRGWVGRSWPVLLLAAMISVLVRWQLTAFMLILGIIVSSLNPLREHRSWSLVALLLVLSALYVLMAPVLEPIRMTFELAAVDYEGSGLYERLVAWQEAGAYWAVFPIKAVHLLFGMGLRMDRLLAPENIYNDVWQLLHSTALLVVCSALVTSRRFRLGNDLVYAGLIYVAVFAITPIYTPRYFYPVYVLWVLAICQPTQIKRFSPKWTKQRPSAVAAQPRAPGSPT
jgi:hypothetical protein